MTFSGIFSFSFWDILLEIVYVYKYSVSEWVKWSFHYKFYILQYIRSTCGKCVEKRSLSHIYVNQTPMRLYLSTIVALQKQKKNKRKTFEWFAWWMKNRANGNTHLFAKIEYEKKKWFKLNGCQLHLLKQFIQQW